MSAKATLIQTFLKKLNRSEWNGGPIEWHYLQSELQVPRRNVCWKQTGLTLRNEEWKSHL
jgi:hypothetical protein